MARVAHTVLYVPVPELEPYIRWRHEVEGPEWLSPDPDHVHAHITVLGPFVPPEEADDSLGARLTELFAAVPPFGFTLEEIRVFPSGLVYLAPAPAGPFARLTAALTAAFPAHPPYAGELEPVPHLSLCALGPGRDLDLVRAELRDLLPVRADAEEVSLVQYAEGGTRTLATYPLGG
jgi:2'-5' RNA ligase